MPREPRVTAKRFWDRVDALAELADARGARFDGDTPDKRRERIARAVVLPAEFNRTYLPHYFRDEGSPFHALLYLALEWSRKVAIRAPRGHAKSTTCNFAYGLHQVVCAPVLKAYTEGTLAESDPELFEAIERVMAEEVARRLEAGPLTLEGLGIPEHWDPEVNATMGAWLVDIHVRLEAEQAIPLHWDPYIQIVAVDVDLAKEFTGAIRAELERNELIRADFGDLSPVHHSDWGKPGFKRAPAQGDYASNGVRVRAFGMQGGLRGGKHGPYRPTLALFDDPDSEGTVATRRTRDAQATKVDSAATYGLDEHRGRIVMVGTPLHSDCVVCRFTEQEKYKGVYDVLRFVAADDDGTILYPAKWTPDAIEAARQNPEDSDPELFDRPPNEGDRPFRELHYYDRADYADVVLPKVMGFDPSYGQNDKSDYQAVITLRGPTPEGWLLVHRADLLRVADPLELTETVNGIYKSEDPDAAVIEAIALGILLHSLSVSLGNAAGVFPAWQRIERQVSAKDIRIRGLAPLINGGTIRFPSDGSCRALENMARDYPQGKKDGLDVLEMALRLIRRGGVQVDIRHVGRERAGKFWGRADEAPRLHGDQQQRQASAGWGRA